MLETSQDLLYIIVAICVAVFTFFLVWIMYYLVQLTKQSNEMVTDFRQKMAELDETIHELKDKVTNSVNTLTAVSDQVGYIIELIKGFASKKISKRKKS